MSSSPRRNPEEHHSDGSLVPTNTETRLRPVRSEVHDRPSPVGLVPRQDSLLVRAARWLEQPEILNAIATSVLGLVSFVVGLFSLWESHPRVVIALGVFAAVICVLQVIAAHNALKKAKSMAEKDADIARLSRKLSRVEEELQISQSKFALYEQMLSRILSNVAIRLNLSSEDRVSIYKREGTTFVLLARHSRNPKFHESKRRAVYPADQGCIARAWEHGEHEITGLPDPRQSPPNYVEAQHKRCNVPLDVASEFTMKSRSYAAFALRHLTIDQPRAVLVFESTNPSRMTVHSCSPVLNDGGRALLEQFLHVFQELEPSPALASEAGY